jgi:hypothetical protein
VGSFVKNIKKVLVAAVVIPGLAFAVQAPNPRSIANNVKNTARSSASADPNVSVRRSATSVIARSVAVNGRKNNTIVRARSVISRTPSNVSVRSGANFVSNNAILSRSATSKPNTIVRSTAKQADTQAGKVSLSRVAKARATAVFDDVSKIGGGYSSCRDAYATCMDQFCAIADDAYRRCYCSDKFATLRDTSDNINTALGILVDFQNNNLNAINKTAAEVDAMYSSTAGEMAIKKDTSASQKMLDEIGDVLSGKKNKKGSSSGNSSLGIIDFTGLADVGDVWSSDSSTVFNSRASDSMSGLEGRALYKRASSQCASIMGANCTSDTMFNLASSAYSIMVTQDCNVLEKTVNAKKENLMQTVRKAEQILRNARLEEYRAHNSQDVNECLNKVEAAMTEPLVCGQNYEKCLDYTGLYINATTGEPISHQLFDLNKISPVLGDIDVIESNPRWNEFLDSKQKFVVTALDTCRNLADDVWLEYKRSAMVRIAQMQDAKIEQFKNSCVQTIKECYNTNDDTLKDLTDDVLGGTAYDVGATRAITVRNVCYQDVLACAAMYGDVDGCQYDQNSRKIVPRKGGGKCGLSALLAYVDSVDTARVAQGCESALIAKAHDMCDPVNSPTTYTTTTTTTTTSTSKAAKLGRMVINHGSLPTLHIGGTILQQGGPQIKNLTVAPIALKVADDSKYPAGCKDWQLSKIQNELKQHAIDFCAINLAAEDRSNVNVSERTTINLNIIKNAIDSVFERLCMDLGYDSKTCHGNYASDLTEEDFNNKHTEQPSFKAKDRLQELVDDYNEHVESNKGAGYGDMGGFGNDRANVYLDTVLSPEEKAKQLVTKGEDVAGQVANIEKDFLMSEAYGTKEMLEGQTQSTLFQSGYGEGAFAGYASYAPGGASTTGSAPAAIGIVDSTAVGLNAMEASSVNAGVATGY